MGNHQMKNNIAWGQCDNKPKLSLEFNCPTFSPAAKRVKLLFRIHCCTVTVDATAVRGCAIAQEEPCCFQEFKGGECHGSTLSNGVYRRLCAPHIGVSNPNRRTDVVGNTCRRLSIPWFAPKFRTVVLGFAGVLEPEGTLHEPGSAFLPPRGAH